MLNFGGNKLSNVRDFLILWSVVGLTSFNRVESADVSGEIKYSEAFWGPGVSIFWHYAEKLLIKSRTCSCSNPQGCH